MNVENSTTLDTVWPLPAVPLVFLLYDNTYIQLNEMKPYYSLLINSKRCTKYFLLIIPKC